TRGGCSYNYGTTSPCRSSALGANRSGTYSHPGRVLLRLPHDLPCRSTAGCPDRPGANRSGAHSHPRRVLLRLRHTLSCRSTASVRTDLARIRTRGGCSYNYGTTSPVGAPPSVRTPPRPNPLLNLKPDGPLPATLPRARTWRRSCD